MQKKCSPCYQITLTILRIAVGLLFLSHGAQKLFGLLGGSIQEMYSLAWYAGVFEFYGGILIVLGLCTRFVALILSLEMAVAYFKVHHSMEMLSPLQNRGELALLYCFIFLFFVGAGAGKFSFDGLWGMGRNKKAVKQAEKKSEVTAVKGEKMELIKSEKKAAPKEKPIAKKSPAKKTTPKTTTKKTAKKK